MRRLYGGDEAGVYLLDAEPGPVVLHISPVWRSCDELAWVHQLVRHVHTQVPEAVVPLSWNGTTVIKHEGRCAALFPFIDGVRLDRENPMLREAAAKGLAAIHRATRSGFDAPRPPSGRERPSLPSLPAALRDDALDTWWRSVRDRGLMMAPIHGDYYRGNLLCRGNHLVGVIDWHAARVAPLALELAAATFEMCKDSSHHLQVDRAQAFVRAYRTMGGPIPEHEIDVLPSLMRVWIREDAQQSLCHPDDPAERAYAQRQIEAFQDLKERRFSLL